MTSITIFGTGNMGTAIASVLKDGGATTQHISSGDTNSTVDGEMVVLAVPYQALSEIISRYGEQLSGKVVVDITNPLDFRTFDALVVAANGSAASELAAALPGTRVLKAFNTNFAATLTSRTVADQPTTVLVAGDDAQAKQLLIDAVAAGGLAAVDVGSLSRARELEAVGFLQMTLAISKQVAWTGGFALMR